MRYTVVLDGLLNCAEERTGTITLADYLYPKGIGLIGIIDLM